MKRTKLLLAALILGFFVSCSNGSNNSNTSTTSETEEETVTKDEKKEILRFLMSGIWVNEYNLTAEIDLMRENPFWKDKYGNTYHLDIVAYDLENLTIIAKENKGTKREDGVTLHLLDLGDGTYALTWKYDQGKLLFCSFVRKLDRFLD